MIFGVEPNATIAFLGGLFSGALIMKWAVTAFWRGNADAIQRIESGGKLYKVLHATEWENLHYRKTKS